MPGKKQFRKKRKRPARSKRSMTQKLETRVKKLEKRPELKYKDIQSTTAPTQAGTGLSMTFIAQGDDFNQRIGEEIRAMYLNFKLRYTHTAGNQNDQIRTMLVWDKQNNSTGPVFLASSDINQGLLDDLTITPSVLSPHNHRTSQRYVVLYDQLHIINPQAATTTYTKNVRRNFKLRGAVVKYSSSGSLVSDLPSRDLIFIQFSSVTSNVTCTNVFRFWYTDT